MKNNTSRYIIVITFIIVAVLSYIVGNYVPINLFKVNVKVEEISTTEYIRLVISIISIFLTFMAILVALFKDDFRERWKRPKILFSEPNDCLSEVKDQNTSINVIEALQYNYRVQIHNNGSLPSLNTEIYLEKLEFIQNNLEITNPLEISGVPLFWDEKKVKEAIIIPPGGMKMLNIIELRAPEKESLPDKTLPQKLPVLKIGDIIANKEKNSGTWLATFTLYAQNHNPIKFITKVQWDGTWQNRLADMGSILKIELQK
jgi:hypothetical protein